MNNCPICKGAYGGKATVHTVHIPTHHIVDCKSCGRYILEDDAYDDWLRDDNRRVTSGVRTALAHFVRKNQSVHPKKSPEITNEWLERFIKEARPPNLPEQVGHLLGAIGDYVSANGEPYTIHLERDCVIAGCSSDDVFEALLKLLKNQNLIRFIRPEFDRDAGETLEAYDLTMSGWERYLAEKRGLAAGNYGFLAMKFADEVLDVFVDTHLKPKVKDAIGYDVVDLRQVSRAGVIDNILREQIRDAAFVLVDLTHDNSGAYWEAGYAEGLGKPVIYLCERTKFDEAKTHFDTNHCTTVMWSADKPDDFVKELVATIRRSLNLFG